MSGANSTEGSPETASDAASGWQGIDHVQVAIPVGGEAIARAFYRDVLGLPEVSKPPVMAERGGAWFEAGDTRVHVGVEAEFVPARKAHPALRRRDLRAFIEDAGVEAAWSDEIPGVERCHISDPFGNRIELVDVPDDPPVDAAQ